MGIPAPILPCCKRRSGSRQPAGLLASLGSVDTIRSCASSVQSCGTTRLLEGNKDMGLRWQDWPPPVLAALRAGAVIPAHPLALDASRKLDARRQRALTRYYLDAGAGGLAVGVHTTQFAIREAGLYRPVLELAMRSATRMDAQACDHDRGLVRPHRAGDGRGRDRARARLSRRVAIARRVQGSARGRTDRARASGRGRDSAGRLLSAAGRGRPCPSGVVLAPVRCDRECRRHQDCAVQPLPHPRRRARRGGGGRRRSHHPLYRQR